jgi:uncharacterized membrane protein YkoI
MTTLSPAIHAAFICSLFHGGTKRQRPDHQKNTDNARFTMKINLLPCSALAALLLAGCATHHHEDQAALQAQAKVSRADAEKTALAKAPNGTVKEAELEKEKGKLIWSFDITTPDSKEITEVNVDAVTGEVVSVEKEKAKEHEKDKSEDGKKEKDKD